MQSDAVRLGIYIYLSIESAYKFKRQLDAGAERAFERDLVSENDG